jgi:hypothetical protein
MESRFVHFCRSVHAACQELHRQLTLDWDGALPRPKSLDDTLERLERRTARAEVRILVIGPLKSGKSTLMNVLLENPCVSQISPLPSYPCYVEVRDLRRGSFGDPEEEPRSLFYRMGEEDGTPEEYSLEEGLEKLNVLLDDFIACADDTQIEYSQVVQKIDFWAGGSPPEFYNGISAVLVDSPGLFFRARFDKAFLDFNAGASAEGGEQSNYSRIATTLLENSDVVVFVIRPEHLFFHMIAKYLRDFTMTPRVRVFILVNASSSSKTQEGGQILDFDQVAHSDRFLTYFEKHSADRDLLKALSGQSDAISMHFADLLEASHNILVEPANKDRYLRETKTGQTIARIRNYLFQNVLPEKKIENLTGCVRAVLGAAEEYLREARFEEECRKEQGGDRLAAIRARCDEHYRTRQSLQRELEAESRRLDPLREKIRLVAEGSPLERSQDGETRGALELLRQLARVDIPGRLHNSLAELPAKDAIRAAYAAWREGQCGPRCLRRLAEAVWSYGNGGNESLAGLQKKAVREMYAFLVGKAAMTLTLDRLREVNSEILRPPDSLPPNPMLATAPPLLPFERVRALGFLWTKFDPLLLWGEDGERVISTGDQLEFLARKQEAFVDAIWGAAWRLEEHFQPERVREKAVAAYTAEFWRKWESILREELAREEQFPLLNAKIDAETKALEKATSERLALERALSEVDSRLESIDIRLREVAAITANLLPSTWLVAARSA